MRLFPLAAMSAAFLLACDAADVPLLEFGGVPLQARVGYSTLGLQEHLSSEVTFGFHPECPTLTEEHTVTFDGEPAETASRGGLGPAEDGGPPCSVPIFHLRRLEADRVPPTFSDATFEVRDATHLMRLRVKDWWGPHGPVLPPVPVDVAQAEPLEVVQGHDLFIPYLPASADLSKVEVMQGRSGAGTRMELVPEPGGVRLRLGTLAPGTYFFYFTGSVKLQVLECTGTRSACSASSGPHYHRHASRVRILP